MKLSSLMSLCDQNRVSLARTQAICWSIVILGGYLALPLFNAGMISESLRRFSFKSAEVIAGLVALPQMDAALFAALGITYVRNHGAAAPRWRP